MRRIKRSVIFPGCSSWEWRWVINRVRDCWGIPGASSFTRDPLRCYVSRSLVYNVVECIRVIHYRTYMGFLSRDARRMRKWVSQHMRHFTATFKVNQCVYRELKIIILSGEAFLPRCMQCRRGLAMRILSVCQTYDLWQNRRKICTAFYTIRKIIYLSFLRRRMVGGATPSTWNFGSTAPHWHEITDF